MNADWLSQLRSAAVNSDPVRGLTHSFYRYPARFSPQFAASAIELFSKPGDIVLDPFMGGGTSIVEAYALGRVAYGVDLNQLAAFVTRAKLTVLDDGEVRRLSQWLESTLGNFNYRSAAVVSTAAAAKYTRNMSGPAARPIKKVVGFALSNINGLATARSRRFARCILLRTTQWALDGRLQPPSVQEFRARVFQFAEEMFCSMYHLRGLLSSYGTRVRRPRVVCARAEHLPRLPMFRDGEKAALAITSPPYPGVHMLYHRWQVLGRRETPAPYWISNCNDGQGASFYNFGGRHDPEQESYFAAYDSSLIALHSVLKPGGVLIQMVACRNPLAHLPRMTAAIRRAGFEPLDSAGDATSITRDVPGRKWHAMLKGPIETSREFVLVHRRA